MADIRSDLNALTDSLPPELKIAVFVDDLDRCSPEKAVEVLEAIKLLLDFRRFIVCLGIDARIITHAIEDHYGKVFAAAGVTGCENLQKIVQIPFNIPEPSFDEVRRFLNNLLGAAEEEVDTLSFENVEIVTAETAVVQDADSGAGSGAHEGGTPVQGDGSTHAAPVRDDLEIVVERGGLPSSRRNAMPCAHLSLTWFRTPVASNGWSISIASFAIWHRIKDWKASSASMTNFSRGY